MFAELPAEVQHQARRAYRIFRQNPNQPSLRFKPVHPTRPIYSVRIGPGYRAVGILEPTKSSGTESARMETMINCFHNRGADPNPWAEKEAKKRACHPKTLYGKSVCERLWSRIQNWLHYFFERCSLFHATAERSGSNSLEGLGS